MEEVVMEKLMRSYEAEISNPVRGLLFGNLMTAMLIQVRLKNSGYLTTSVDSKDEGKHGECCADNGQSKFD